MYKVLLADESDIQSNMVTTILTKQFGREIKIVMVHSGREAIEMGTEWKPDLLIINIQVSGINGVAAVREIMKQNVELKVILTSNYERMEFCKAALKIGVSGYLVKPIETNVLIQQVKKALTEVEVMRHLKHQELVLREKISLLEPVVAGTLIRWMLTGEHAERYEKYLELLNVYSKEGQIIVLEGYEAGMNEESYNKIYQLISEVFTGLVGDSIGNRIPILIIRESDSLKRMQQGSVVKQAERLSKSIRKQFGITIRVGIGGKKESKRLHESYEEAIQALRMEEGDVVLFKGSVPSPLSSQYEAELIRNLLGMMERGNQIGTRVDAMNYYSWLVKMDQYNNMERALKLLEIVFIAENRVVEQDSKRNTIKERSEYLRSIQSFSNSAQLESWFVEKLMEVAKSMTGVRKKRVSGIIQKATQYIDQHYNQEITLEDIAREVDISPYYLSKLFKEEMGENYIEYLTNQRVEHAKMSLKNISLTIKEVGINVGYSDPNYFSRIFKKYVGVTPSEYRNGQ